MSEVIAIENICYHVNSKKILNNINLTIDSKDSFALIGKNGAGKTTLFEIVLKDIKPTKGNVSFGKEIGDNFKNTGVVYDHSPLFPLLKVKEMISYFASMYRIRPSNIPLKYFEIFGLKDILNSYIQSLSQGERKRISLFLSIIHDPVLLILDEPFSNIDPTVMDGIWQVLKENNRTILFTTHNWKMVEEVATKIAFINKGELVMKPSSTKEIINLLPHTKKVITDFNEDLVEKIKDFDFYVNEDLLHIFNNNDSRLIDVISKQTNNFSFKECDVKDAYLFKIRNNE